MDVERRLTLLHNVIFLLNPLLPVATGKTSSKQTSHTHTHNLGPIPEIENCHCISKIRTARFVPRVVLVKDLKKDK